MPNSIDVALAQVHFTMQEQKLCQKKGHLVCTEEVGPRQSNPIPVPSRGSIVSALQPAGSGNPSFKHREVSIRAQHLDPPPSEHETHPVMVESRWGTQTLNTNSL